jgi:hypothetical protein
VNCDRLKDDEISPELSSSTLRASAVAKRLNGEPDGVLVRASDGLLYVVKLMESIRGRNVLANKALGNELAKYLGLSVPDWRPIEISEACLERYSLLHGTGSESRLNRPGPGLYFGSRAVVQDDPDAVYKELPGNWLHKIGNRNDFAGILLLDLWANQAGRRKALFVLSSDGANVRAIFTGNSQLFGGFSGSEEQRRGATLYRDRRVYAGLDVNRAFSLWLQKAVALDEAMLLRLASVIPRQWHDSSYPQRVASQLQIRKWRVAQLLDEEMSLIAKSTRENISLIGLPSKSSPSEDGVGGEGGVKESEQE